MLITKKDPDELEEGDDEPSVMDTVSNENDAPASHLIELYAMRWHLETFFGDTQEDLGR